MPFLSGAWRPTVANYFDRVAKGRTLEALEAGSVSVLPLISERFALSDGVGALDAAKRRGVLKVLIDVASS